jgi:fumarate hydratase class I
VTSIKQEDLIQSIADALQYISYYHPVDYIKNLAAAYEREESPAAKDAMAQILINSRMCAEGHRPICQDTGIVTVFLEIGMNVRWDDATMGVEDMANEGVRRAYNYPDNKLRASVLADPAGKRINTKDNTPGVVNVKVVPGNTVEVIVAAKGGGSEAKSSSPCSTRPIRSWTGCSRPCRPWAQAGARRACSASASAVPPRRRCCWPRKR